MSSDDNFGNILKSRENSLKHMKQATRWINAEPKTQLQPVSKLSRLVSITSKLKSLILSKDKQHSPEDTGRTFHQFSLLPKELQVQIWTYAAQTPLFHDRNHGIVSSDDFSPSSTATPTSTSASTSTSTTTPPNSESESSLTSLATKSALTTESSPTSTPSKTFSSHTLSPFFSLADSIPSSNPHTKIFFPIAPLLHTCSLSRHIFQQEWERRLPDHLRGIIARTGNCKGKWAVLMTRVLEGRGMGILVIDKEEGRNRTGIERTRRVWCGGRSLDRKEGIVGKKVVTYYLFECRW